MVLRKPRIPVALEGTLNRIRDRPLEKDLQFPFRKCSFEKTKVRNMHLIQNHMLINQLLTSKHRYVPNTYVICMLERTKSRLNRNWYKKSWYQPFVISVQLSIHKSRRLNHFIHMYILFPRDVRRSENLGRGQIVLWKA